MIALHTTIFLEKDTPAAISSSKENFVLLIFCTILMRTPSSSSTMVFTYGDRGDDGNNKKNRVISLVIM